MDSFKSIAVFCLFFSLTYAISPSCTKLVVKPKEECITKSNVTNMCCNEWCTAYCDMTTYYMDCTVEYIEINECCPGYGGQDCGPVCSIGCSVNGQCILPGNCSCMDGWTGENCQQVSGLKAINVLNDSISLTWDMPATTSNINGYYIYTDNNNMTILDVINKTTIEDLLPYTSYRACVVPLVFEGNGTEYCIYVTTAEGVPTPPLNVSVLGFSSSAVLIKWLPPTHPNGIITGYTLYIDYPNNSISTVTISRELSLYFIEGLETNQNVAVSVSAATIIGNGLQSDTVSDETTDKLSTNIPSDTANGDLQLTPLSDTTLQLSWIPPSNDIVSFHLLRIIDIRTNNTIYQWAVRPDQTFEYILKLDQYVPYKFKEFAGITETNGFGLTTENTFFVKEGVPSVYPSNFSARRITEGTISISWHPISLMESRGIITKYTVHYSKGVGSCDYTLDNNELTTLDTNVVLDNIAIDMIYCVQVFASTKEGSGPKTPLIMVPLKEYTPISFFLFGVNDCESWRNDDSCTDVRMTEFRQRLITVLNQNCSCITSDSYFFDEQFVCNSSTSVKYTANLISSYKASSEILSSVLETWIDDSPNVIVQGMSLHVTMTTDDVGSEMCSKESDNHIVIYGVLGCLLGVSVFGWIILGLVVCLTRRKSKDYQAPDSMGSRNSIT